MMSCCRPSCSSHGEEQGYLFEAPTSILQQVNNATATHARNDECNKSKSAIYSSMYNWPELESSPEGRPQRQALLLSKDAILVGLVDDHHHWIVALCASRKTSECMLVVGMSRMLIE